MISDERPDLARLVAAHRYGRCEFCNEVHVRRGDDLFGSIPTAEGNTRKVPRVLYCRVLVTRVHVNLLHIKLKFTNKLRLATPGLQFKLRRLPTPVAIICRCLDALSNDRPKEARVVAVAESERHGRLPIRPSRIERESARSLVDDGAFDRAARQ
jgi:hypothetical protein